MRAVAVPEPGSAVALVPIAVPPRSRPVAKAGAVACRPTGVAAVGPTPDVAGPPPGLAAFAPPPGVRPPTPHCIQKHRRTADRHIGRIADQKLPVRIHNHRVHNHQSLASMARWATPHMAARLEN